MSDLARNFAMRDGAQGFAAVGPGAAAKCPQGVALAEIARKRMTPKQAWRKVWCSKSGCLGHEDGERC